MKAPRFHYVRADSLEHALRLLAEHGDEARILAGGQSLMPTLNMRLSQPKVLIDINRIAELKGISLRDGMVRIGALSRHVEVMGSDVIAQRLPLIAEAMPHVAHFAVGESEQVFAVEKYFAVDDPSGWRDQTHHGERRDRLSTARLTHESEQLAAIKMKTHPIHGAHESAAGLKMRL